MQGGLPKGSGLHIPPCCLPILPPSLPSSRCAALRVTSCSETEGFFSSIFKEAAEEPGEACCSHGLLPSRPAPRRHQLLRGSWLGRPAWECRPPAQGRLTADLTVFPPLGWVFLWLSSFPMCTLPRAAIPAAQSRPRRRREATLARGDAKGLPGPAPPAVVCSSHLVAGSPLALAGSCFLPVPGAAGCPPASCLHF